jgi:hypothetical protein
VYQALNTKALCFGGSNYPARHKLLVTRGNSF